MLARKGADAANCLTAPQVEAARKIYAPPTNPRTKQKLFGPLLPGSELGWAAQAGAEPFGYGVGFFRYLVFKDPKWDYKTRPINFDSDAKAADALENLIVNANNPNISKFIARGGKLWSIGGWSDSANAPFSNTEYFDAVREKLGPKRMQDSSGFSWRRTWATAREPRDLAPTTPTLSISSRIGKRRDRLRISSS